MMGYESAVIFSEWNNNYRFPTSLAGFKRRCAWVPPTTLTKRQAGLDTLFSALTAENLVMKPLLVIGFMGANRECSEHLLIGQIPTDLQAFAILKQNIRAQIFNVKSGYYDDLCAFVTLKSHLIVTALLFLSYD
jgi:hypothetical protein